MCVCVCVCGFDFGGGWKGGISVKKFRKKARELTWAEFSSRVFPIPGFAPVIISE